MTQESPSLKTDALSPKLASTRGGQTDQNPKRKRPKRYAGFIDECYDVHCRECGVFLACATVNAEVLCQTCSTQTKYVWTTSVAPVTPVKYTSARRQARRKASE